MLKAFWAHSVFSRSNPMLTQWVVSQYQVFIEMVRACVNDYGIYCEPTHHGLLLSLYACFSHLLSEGSYHLRALFYWILWFPGGHLQLRINDLSIYLFILFILYILFVLVFDHVPLKPPEWWRNWTRHWISCFLSQIINIFML